MRHFLANQADNALSVPGFNISTGDGSSKITDFISNIDEVSSQELPDFYILSENDISEQYEALELEYDSSDSYFQNLKI